MRNGKEEQVKGIVREVADEDTLPTALEILIITRDIVDTVYLWVVNNDLGVLLRSWGVGRVKICAKGSL